MYNHKTTPGQNSLLALIFIVLSCTDQPNDLISAVPIRTVVTGTVINVIPDLSSISLVINRVGFGQEEVVAQLDSKGNFKFEFETYVPLDAWIVYHTNALIVLMPGDSLNVELDASRKGRPEVLKSMKFGGSGAEHNGRAAFFQADYFQSLDVFGGGQFFTAAAKYGPEQFNLFADSLRQRHLVFLKDFVSQYGHDEFVQNWASAFLVNDYYNVVNLYPNEHRAANQLKEDEWDVPATFYDFVKEPISVESSLQSAYAIDGYVNRYSSRIRRLAMQGFRSVDDAAIDEAELAYSTKLNKILTDMPRGLLREALITHQFDWFLESSHIDLFEKFYSVAEDNIKSSFLREPLFRKYRAIRDELLKGNEVASSPIASVDDLLKELFSGKRGKGSYVDIWATWCGPCIKEFPSSNRLQEEYSNRLDFIYICIDSDEAAYKNALRRYQLNGTNYFLDREQSKAIRTRLGLSGVPEYMLIDERGSVVDRGKPSQERTKRKIEELVKKLQ